MECYNQENVKNPGSGEAGLVAKALRKGGGGRLRGEKKNKNEEG